MNGGLQVVLWQWNLYRKKCVSAGTTLKATDSRIVCVVTLWVANPNMKAFFPGTTASPSLRKTGRVVALGGFCRPQWPPRRPLQGRAHRLVAWHDRSILACFHVMCLEGRPPVGPVSELRGVADWCCLASTGGQTSYIVTSQPNLGNCFRAP